MPTHIKSLTRYDLKLKTVFNVHDDSLFLSHLVPFLEKIMDEERQKFKLGVRHLFVFLGEAKE